MRAWLIPPTLRNYEATWLRSDVLAGLTLVAIAVPEQMATARLANLPAILGLYAFVAGSLLFALIGKSRQLSVGADSTIAPVLAAGVVSIAAVGTPSYTDLVSLLAVMVGALVIAFGLLRMGWIAQFLSTPVIAGVLGGIAVEIVVRQLPEILGIPGGGASTVGRLEKIVDQIGHTNGWALAIAIGVLALVVAAERVDRRIPGALIGLVASIVVVATCGLRSHGVEVFGEIHGHLPHFAVPSATWSQVRHLLGPAFTIAFLCVMQTATSVRSSKEDSPAAADFDRNLIAVGAGSLVAGFGGSFAVNASPPRTTVVAAAGGRTQLTGIIAALVVLALVLLATGLLTDLPKATLGAILVFVATRLFRGRELRSILSFDRIEFALAIIALVSVALLGIEPGVGLAMLLALADRTRRAARPRDAVLGREPGTVHWITPDVGVPTEQVPGVIVYLIYAPLWYGNADYVRARINTMIVEAKDPVRALVIDANGISDIDYTGAQALRALRIELEQRGVTIEIARSSHLVHHDLRRSGVLAELGSNHLYSSVEEAVEAVAPAR